MNMKIISAFNDINGNIYNMYIVHIHSTLYIYIHRYIGFWIAICKAYE